jgi:hypothetical protein
MDLSRYIPQIVANGIEWVNAQNNLYKHLGVPLSEDLQVKFAHYFDGNLLNQVRITRVQGITNPDIIDQYRPLLKLFGIPVLDFGSMAGMAFVDLILLAEPLIPDNHESIIFHEMVHVLQYSLLGVDKFVEMYITGWAKQGFNINKIPLEKVANGLQEKFDNNGSEPFSVKEELMQHIGSLI